MNPRMLAGKKLDRLIRRVGSAQRYASDPVEVVGQRRMTAVISDRQTVTEGAAVKLYKQLCPEWPTQNNSGPPHVYLNLTVQYSFLSVQLKRNLLHCIYSTNTVYILFTLNITPNIISIISFLNFLLFMLHVYSCIALTGVCVDGPLCCCKTENVPYLIVPTDTSLKHLVSFSLFCLYVPVNCGIKHLLGPGNLKCCM